MGFLGKLLDRPANERAFVLIPVGYPSDGCVVPSLERKPVEEILCVVERRSASTPRPAADAEGLTSSL